MRRLLREPLLHFFVLGALLFVFYGWLGRGSSLTPGEVVVDQARADLLAIQFDRTWQRPPTRDELQGLIDNWVRDEIIFREGLAQGMDRNDEIVRRRVVQKMSFLVDGMTADVPSEVDLQDWLREHPDDYRVSPTYTLHQVYFDPQRHGGGLASVIQAAKAALERNPKATAGDAIQLPATLKGESSDEVTRIFGKGFADSLTQLPVGRWAGPVASGYGLHLVRIDARTSGRIPALSEVRPAVERDLLHARSAEATEAFYSSLRKNYKVKIEADLDNVGSGAATRPPVAVSSSAAPP